MSTGNLLNFSNNYTPVPSASPKYNNWLFEPEPTKLNNKSKNKPLKPSFTPLSHPTYSNNLSPPITKNRNVRSSKQELHNNQFEQLTPPSLVLNNQISPNQELQTNPRPKLINYMQSSNLSLNNTLRIDSTILLIGVLEKKINELKKSRSEGLYKEVDERIKSIAVALLKEQKSNRRYIEEKNHFLNLVEEFNKIEPYIYSPKRVNNNMNEFEEFNKIEPLYSPKRVNNNMNEFLYDRLSNNNKRAIIRKNLKTKNDKLYTTLSEKITELDSLIQKLNIKDNKQIKNIKLKISDIEGIFAYLSGRNVNDSFNILKQIFHTMTANFYTITVGDTIKNNFYTINVGNTKTNISNLLEYETEGNKKFTKIQTKINNNSREHNIIFIQNKLEEIYNSTLKTSTGKIQISKYYINIKKYLKKCTITDEDILSMVEIINDTIDNMNNNINNKVSINTIVYGMFHSLNEIAINHKLKNKGKEIGKFIIGNEYKIKIDDDYKLCEFIKYNKTMNKYYFCNNDKIIVIDDPKKIKSINYKESTVKKMFKFFKK